MMQAIGLMIALYIITRMAELIDRKDRGIALKTLAAATMIAAVIGLFSLLATPIPPLR